MLCPGLCDSSRQQQYSGQHNAAMQQPSSEDTGNIEHTWLETITAGYSLERDLQLRLLCIGTRWSLHSKSYF